MEEYTQTLNEFLELDNLKDHPQTSFKKINPLHNNNNNTTVSVSKHHTGEFTQKNILIQVSSAGNINIQRTNSEQGQWTQYRNPDTNVLSYDSSSKRCSWSKPPPSSDSCDKDGKKEDPTETLNRNSLSTRTKPTQGLPLIHLSITLVDNSNSHNIVVSEDFTAQEVMYAYCNNIGLWQLEYFALCCSHNGQDYWLDYSKPVGPQLMAFAPKLGLKFAANEKPSFNLQFKAKIEKQPKKLIDPIAINCWYRQIRKYLVEGLYVTSVFDAVKLAALMLQEKFGDYNPQSIQQYTSKETLESILCKYVREHLPVEYLHHQLLVHYSLLRGMDKVSCQYHFIHQAKKVSPFFGVKFWRVTCEGVMRMIGVNEHGVMISHGWTIVAEKDSRDTYDVINYPEILDCKITAKGLIIILNDKAYYEFITPHNHEITQLIHMYSKLLMRQIQHSADLPPKKASRPGPGGGKAATKNRKRLGFTDKELAASPYNSSSESDSGSSGSYSIDQNYNNTEKQFQHTIQEAKAFISKRNAKNLKMGSFTDFRLFVETDPTLLPKLIDHCVSRGQIFYNSYLENCKLASIPPKCEILYRFDEARFKNERLDCLDLSGCDLSGTDLQVIASSLMKTFKYPSYECLIEDIPFTKVDLSGNNHLNRYVAQLGQMILTVDSFLPGVQKVLLNDMDLVDGDAKLLSESIQCISNLTGLSFSSNKITRRGAKYIIRAANTIGCTIEYLDLSNNFIDRKISRELQKLFQNKRKIGINLNGNRLDDKGVKFIATMLWDLSSQHQVTSIGVSGVGMKHRAAGKLARCVVKHRHVTELDMSYNNLKGKYAKYLTQLLAQSAIRKLDLKVCNLNNEVVGLLMGTLEATNSLSRVYLEDLNLSQNVLSPANVQKLANAISTSSTITHLSLCDCSLNKQSMLALIRGLKNNSSLKSLNLSVNQAIADVEVSKMFCEMLSSHKTLEKLQLSMCQLNNKTVVLNIAQGIAHCKPLRVVHVEENRIGALVEVFAQAINVHGKLTEISLRKNALSQKLIDKFFNSLTPICSLRKLDLTANHFSDSKMKNIQCRFPYLEIIT